MHCTYVNHLIEQGEEKINSMNIHSQYNLEAATPWCWHYSSDSAFRILLVQGLAQANTILKFGIFV